MQFYGLLALVFVLLVAIFAVQNAVPVDIHFLVWQFPQVSLVIVIFTSALAGALIMVFLGIVRHFKTLGRQTKGKLPGSGSSSGAQAGEEDLGPKSL